MASDRLSQVAQATDSAHDLHGEPSTPVPRRPLDRHTMRSSRSPSSSLVGRTCTGWTGSHRPREVRIGRTRFRPIGQTGVLACAYQAGRGLPVASLRSQLLLDRGEIDRSALPADQAVAKCRRRARSGSGRVGPARPDRMGAPSRWRVGPTHRRRGRRRTDGGRVRTGRSASRRTGPGRTPRSAPHRAGSGRGARRRRARHRAGSPQRSRPDRRSFFAR
jgi:hypothetical protein